MSVQLIARRKVTYANRALRPGESFEASSKDAAILTAIGAAEAAQSVDEPAAVESESEEPRRQRRRSYRRRDMIAEGDAE